MSLHDMSLENFVGDFENRNFKCQNTTKLNTRQSQTFPEKQEVGKKREKLRFKEWHERAREEEKEKRISVTREKGKAKNFSAPFFRFCHFHCLKKIKFRLVFFIILFCLCLYEIVENFRVLDREAQIILFLLYVVIKLLILPYPNK